MSVRRLPAGQVRRRVTIVFQYTAGMRGGPILKRNHRALFVEPLGNRPRNAADQLHARVDVLAAFDLRPLGEKGEQLSVSGTRFDLDVGVAVGKSRGHSLGQAVES